MPCKDGKEESDVDKAMRKKEKKLEAEGEKDEKKSYPLDKIR